MPAKKKENEVANGIMVEPVPITLGEKVKIKYLGMLSESGSKKVFLHAGFGHGKWDKVIDVPMRKDKNGHWSASIEAEDPSCLNFCFHDDANNWDNNNGRNWTYEVHTGDTVES